MHIAVVGLSHRTAPVEVREKLSIPEELVERSFNNLKKIDQNHDLNFSQSKELFWDYRRGKILQYISIYEDYNDGKHNYTLARFDKNSYTNAFYEELAKVDRLNRERMKSIDSVISLDNFKNIAEILNETVFHTGSNGLVRAYSKNKKCCFMLLVVILSLTVLKNFHRQN